MTIAATEKPAGAVSPGPRVIADIGSREGWDGLLEAFRKRVAELGTTYESVDHVAGLPTRYTGKLLAPVPIKGLGRQSLGPLLGALGLRLLIVVDEEALARIATRHTPKNPSVVLREKRATLLHQKAKETRGGLRWVGASDWCRIMNAQIMLLKTPAWRSKRARKAALARHRRHKFPPRP